MEETELLPGLYSLATLSPIQEVWHSYTAEDVVVDDRGFKAQVFDPEEWSSHPAPLKWLGLGT